MVADPETERDQAEPQKWNGDQVFAQKLGQFEEN